MHLVILDRDGVINQDSAEFIKSPEEWIAIAGSLEAIARLTQAGYRVVIASNQSGLARGLFSIDTLNRIHEKMNRQLAELGGSIEAIFFCPHGPKGNCPCRKPKPGLFLDIAARLGLSLSGVPAVGDSLRDLQAAAIAGATPVLVRSGKGRQTEEKLAGAEINPVAVHDDLAAFVDTLLEKK
jgi:D-glycero-D-manno-heptose 1,7-bisphosphate phosphatase